MPLWSRYLEYADHYVEQITDTFPDVSAELVADYSRLLQSLRLVTRTRCRGRWSPVHCSRSYPSRTGGTTW